MSYTVLQCPVLTAKERPHRRFSQPMKALFKLFRRFDARRIFGFIRRLGGMSRPKVKCYDLRSTRALRVEGDLVTEKRASNHGHFYPRPPGGGRPAAEAATAKVEKISIHALRVEGDKQPSSSSAWSSEFLSTPSGWRATMDKYNVLNYSNGISIHALRVEGDHANRAQNTN